MYRRTAKNHLRDVFRTHKIRNGVGYASAFQAHYGCAEALREASICRQRILIRFFRPNFAFYVNYV